MALHVISLNRLAFEAQTRRACASLASGGGDFPGGERTARLQAASSRPKRVVTERQAFSSWDPRGHSPSLWWPGAPRTVTSWLPVLWWLLTHPAAERFLAPRRHLGQRPHSRGCRPGRWAERSDCCRLPQRHAPGGTGAALFPRASSPSCVSRDKCQPLAGL